MAPGSIEPERVAIGTPSSGLKPIVVSTERPSSTAVTEQPPPRWQTTSRETSIRSATDGEAVEAVAAYPPLLAPALRDCVRGGLVRDAAMECGVEDGNVRNVRQRRLRRPDAAQRRLGVERRQRGELADLLDHVGIDPRRVAEDATAVDDSMPDRTIRRHPVERPDLLGTLVLVDDGELEARRARR